MQLRASISEQNRAIDGMAKATAAAQQRGEEARALAAARGRKLDAVQQQQAGARHHLRRGYAGRAGDVGSSAMIGKIVNLNKLAALSLLLAGCGSVPPAPVRVEVPVMVPCIGEVPPRPAYEFDQLSASATDGEIILALARDWVHGRKYERQLETNIAGCR